MSELSGRLVLKDPIEARTAITALGVVENDRLKLILEVALSKKLDAEAKDPYHVFRKPEVELTGEDAIEAIGDIIMGLELVVARTDAHHDLKMAAFALHSSMIGQRTIQR